MAEGLGGASPTPHRAPPAPGGGGYANPASGQPWGPRAPVLIALGLEETEPGEGAAGRTSTQAGLPHRLRLGTHFCFSPMLRTAPGLWRQEDTRNACWKWTRGRANACKHPQFRTRQERAAPASTSPGWPWHTPFSGASVSLTENNSIGFPTRCISNRALLSFRVRRGSSAAMGQDEAKAVGVWSSGFAPLVSCCGCHVEPQHWRPK